jgi:hypothetical protein
VKISKDSRGRGGILTSKLSQNRNQPTNFRTPMSLAEDFFENRTDECVRPYVNLPRSNHVTVSVLDYSCNLADWLPPHVGSLQMICFF